MAFLWPRFLALLLYSIQAAWPSQKAAFKNAKELKQACAVRILDPTYFYDF